MKTIFSSILVMLLITSLFACKKDKGNDNNNNPDSILGTWELAETSSSWFPLETFEPGNGNKLDIHGDTYAYYKNGAVIETGNYTTAPDSTVELNVCLLNLKDNYTTRMDLTNVTPARTTSVFKTFFYIADNKLYMISGCYAIDAGSKKVYRRSRAIIED